MIRPRLKAGSTRLRSCVPQSLPPPLPITGNQRSWMANTSSIRMADTKAGNDSPVSDSRRPR